MAFNSYSYLVFLIPAVALYWQLPRSWRTAYLLVVSLAYYATWTPWHVVLPFVLCGMAFGCARRIRGDASRAVFWLRLGIVAVLTVLAFFKYRDFALANVNDLLRSLHMTPWETGFRLALPLGISFYSFEAISYLIDTYQGRVKEVRFSDLALFVTFWPHLMAGPIVRVRELIPQFGKDTTFNAAMFRDGIGRLLYGLALKNVWANSLAPMVEEGFLHKSAQSNSSLDNWTVAVAFGLQIYFDFASYSHMAVGAAKLVGITLPENFRYPYYAWNPSDFWSRWHMTLSRWIRDYLFFRVNVRYKGAPVPLYISMLVIMALVGLWHGAGWGFVMWGVFHGVYLVLYRAWESLVETRFPAWAQAKWAHGMWRVFTLAAVVVAWVPFRAAEAGDTLLMLRTMLVSPRLGLSYGVNLYLITALATVYCAVEPWLAEGWEALQQRLSRNPRVAWVGLALHPAVWAVALLFFLLFDDQDTKFIYFQF